jgi:crooked neck
VWKAYIDFEISENEHERVRTLYQDLIERTNHLKVWLSWARFEIENAEDYEASRAVFQKGYECKYFKSEPEMKEERLMLLENWLKLEEACGSSD